MNAGQSIKIHNPEIITFKMHVVENFSGVLVYLVDNMKNEIYLKPHHMNNVERHKVNWPIGKIWDNFITNSIGFCL